MSIKSTQHISRESAIERIQLIYVLMMSQNYKQLEAETFERHYDITEVVANVPHVEISNLANFTNTMLEELMDIPYYRFSLFDNYLVEA